MEQHSVRTQEKIAYGFGCFGQNMLYNLMANFLLFFYTDIFGILPAAAGTILLVARIWDAVNDPLMGMIADRTHSRWGKFRPYLLFTPILFLPFAVASFSAPQFSHSGKVAWAAITYICFGMIYTASDVPFWAMSSTISEDTKVRSSVVVYPRFMATVAVALATLATQPLIMLFSVAGKPERGYQMTSLVYSLLTVVCFLIAFLAVKERVVTNEEQKPRFSDIPKIFLSNKPLLLVSSVGFSQGSGKQEN
jgi:GPH family glycoside/pentoside/hexuronide:cation symporter/probable glucitol transport protein GutA